MKLALFEGEFQLFFFVAHQRSDLFPTMASRNTTVDMAAERQLNLRKQIEFTHGGFLWNFLQKTFWTVVTEVVEWNSGTQNAFLG
jgi:hypothetical protein